MVKYHRITIVKHSQCSNTDHNDQYSLAGVISQASVQQRRGEGPSGSRGVRTVPCCTRGGVILKITQREGS